LKRFPSVSPVALRPRLSRGFAKIIKNITTSKYKNQENVTGGLQRLWLKGLRNVACQ
jgi:hypothetical protein